MHISIDTTVELSAIDLAVLRALAGDAPSTPVSSPTVAKAAPAKAPAAKAPEKAEKAAPAEPEEADEPDTADEGDGEDAPTYTQKDAVKLATELVSSGKAAQVKKVLTDLGAKRVSELSESDIPAFISALS